MNKRVCYGSGMNLLLITHCYPFKLEEAFLENEIDFLSNQFEKIYILPTIIDKNMACEVRQIPSNCEVILFDHFFEITDRRLGKNIFQILPIFFSSLILDIKYLSNWKASFNFLNVKVTLKHINGGIIWGKYVKKWLKDNDIGPMIIYSYWLDTWLLELFNIKRLYPKVIKRIIARAHRYDVYFEYSYNKFLPLRPYLLKHIDEIYPISKQGNEYLRNKISLPFQSTISYLGVFPKSDLNQPSKDNIFRILSCSSLIPRKRVNLLLEAIKRLDFEISWTHIGDGPLKEKLTLAAESLGNNISWDFTGLIPNQEVNQYYLENPVDLFVNTSDSEGIPVSIMEAMSFGVPVVATDVGGTSELLDEGGGFLVPSDIGPDELAEEIRLIKNKSREEINILRNKAINKYLKDFHAENNYKEFCKFLTIDQ